MKMKTLLASGLCFALTVPLLAQEKATKETDSIYITPFAGARIILVGKGIEKLLKENDFEVLKNKFVEDYRESAKDKDFPASAKNILYFAGADGRRRLKAVPDEAAPVDVQEEIRAFNNNLPPFHYTIYDLMKDYQYHIYVAEPEKLDSLQRTNTDSLIKTVTTLHEKKNYKTLDRLEIKPNAMGQFVSSTGGQKRYKALAIAPQFGLGFINSTIAPTIGYTVSLNFLDRYGKVKHELGLGSDYYVIADYANKTFSNFYPVNLYNLYYMRHFGKSGVGITTGFFRDSKRNDGTTDKGSLHKAWEFGFLSKYDRFTLEYNYIYDKRKNTNLAFTLRYLF